MVTTRRPDGTEVKAGATTTAVAPDDVALHEATKRDGDTVQVETPEQNMGDQAAKVQAEIAARKAEMDAAERGVFTGEIKPEEMFTPESKPSEPVAAAPVDPLAGATKLSENKSGVSVHRLPEGAYGPEGPYRKVRNGEISTISEDSAKILTGEKTFASETSTAEAIRQQAEKTAPAPDADTPRDRTEGEKAAAASAADNRCRTGSEDGDRSAAPAPQNEGRESPAIWTQRRG